MTRWKTTDRDGGLSADADPELTTTPISAENLHHAAVVVCDRLGSAYVAAPVLAALGLVGGEMRPLRLLGTVKP